MDDFRDIAFLAQKAANATDLQQKLRIAKQLDMLLRSAMIALKIKIKKTNGG